jgi:hypothetical protein
MDILILPFLLSTVVIAAERHDMSAPRCRTNPEAFKRHPPIPYDRPPPINADASLREY